MTPAERRLRDAWLSELWPTCREWHQTTDERADAWQRNELLREADAQRVDKAAGSRGNAA